jgi:HSP20 family protein
MFPALREMDSLMSDLLTVPRPRIVFESRWHSSETDSAFTLELEVPGIPKENIIIQAADGVLSVKTQGLNETRGRGLGAEKTFRIPRSVDESKIEGQVKDGLLTITLPKRAQSSAHLIPIK